MIMSLCIKFIRFSSSATNMELREVVRRLQMFASPKLAESWDNTGLLVEPSSVHTVKSLLLTNDLTETVVDEAVDRKSNMVLSYHPPIFQPLKCLLQHSWKERIIVKCIENRIAVFSPHTTYDTLDGGVNDWLISPFGGKVEPLKTWTSPNVSTCGEYSVNITVSLEITSQVSERLKQLSGVVILGLIRLDECSKAQMRLNVTEKALVDLVSLLKDFDDVMKTMEITQLTKPPMPNNGRGRRALLDRPITISRCVEMVKSHLRLPHVRLALATNKQLDSEVISVAVCAGSGASVLSGVGADLYVTGEMSHHDVINANHCGSTVILCDHSNTERGFLTELRSKLLVLFDGAVDVHLSERDRDPLEVV